MNGGMARREREHSFRAFSGSRLLRRPRMLTRFGSWTQPLAMMLSRKSGPQVRARFWRIGYLRTYELGGQSWAIPIITPYSSSRNNSCQRLASGSAGTHIKLESSGTNFSIAIRATALLTTHFYWRASALCILKTSNSDEILGSKRIQARSQWTR